MASESDNLAKQPPLDEALESLEGSAAKEIEYETGRDEMMWLQREMIEEENTRRD